jgi:hypothetical protein
MTDREAVYLLTRVNRRVTLLTTSPIVTDEQIITWKKEIQAGITDLYKAGYTLHQVNIPPHYMFHEPAEALT